MIREEIGKMDGAARAAFVADFKRQFGMGLGDLPVPRHGDALTWTRKWKPPSEAPSEAPKDGKAPDGDAVDAAWVEQAQGGAT